MLVESPENQHSKALPFGCCRFVTRAWTAYSDCSSLSATFSTYFLKASDHPLKTTVFNLLSAALPDFQTQRNSLTKWLTEDTSVVTKRLTINRALDDSGDQGTYECWAHISTHILLNPHANVVCSFRGICRFRLLFYCYSSQVFFQALLELWIARASRLVRAACWLQFQQELEILQRYTTMLFFFFNGQRIIEWWSNLRFAWQNRRGQLQVAKRCWTGRCTRSTDAPKLSSCPEIRKRNTAISKERAL